jgi:hypothetical protein
MSLVHPINRDPSILGEVGQAHLAARILFLQIEIEIGIERGAGLLKFAGCALRIALAVVA